MHSVRLLTNLLMVHVRVHGHHGWSKSMDGELWSVIQEHLDRYGVREAAFARRMGTSPQTINTWKTQGMKRLPERWLLQAVARETGTPYSAVLHAALIDTGYMPDGPVTDGPERPATPQAPEPAPAGEHRPAPHSTPVTEADIDAGAGLPLAAPGHRRTTRSSGTTARRHTS